MPLLRLYRFERYHPAHYCTVFVSFVSRTKRSQKFTPVLSLHPYLGCGGVSSPPVLHVCMQVALASGYRVLVKADSDNLVFFIAQTVQICLIAVYYYAHVVHRSEQFVRICVTIPCAYTVQILHPSDVSNIPHISIYTHYVVAFVSVSEGSHHIYSLVILCHQLDVHEDVCRMCFVPFGKQSSQLFTRFFSRVIKDEEPITSSIVYSSLSA